MRQKAGGKLQHLRVVQVRSSFIVMRGKGLKLAIRETVFL
jgi:hypothetical protein